MNSRNSSIHTAAFRPTLVYVCARSGPVCAWRSNDVKSSMAVPWGELVVGYEFIPPHFVRVRSTVRRCRGCIGISLLGNCRADCYCWPTTPATTSNKRETHMILCAGNTGQLTINRLCQTYIFVQTRKSSKHRLQLSWSNSSKIPFLNRTVSTIIHDLADYILRHKLCHEYSRQLNKTTDVTNLSILLLFTRYLIQQ